MPLDKSKRGLVHMPCVTGLPTLLVKTAEIRKSPSDSIKQKSTPDTVFCKPVFRHSHRLDIRYNVIYMARLPQSAVTSGVGANKISEPLAIK